MSRSLNQLIASHEIRNIDITKKCLVESFDSKHRDRFKGSKILYLTHRKCTLYLREEEVLKVVKIASFRSMFDSEAEHIDKHGMNSSSGFDDW